MNIKYDDRTITCDLQLALQLFCKNVELYQNFDRRLDFLKQLFNIKLVYNGRTYKEYILKTHVDGLLKEFKTSDITKLEKLLLYHFSGNYGADIKKIDDSTIQVLSYDD